MRHIDAPDLLLYSATQIATDLGLSPKELAERAASLGIDFWLQPQPGLTIFSIITHNLNGHPIHSPPLKSNVFLTPSFPTLTKLLCIKATEARSIAQLQSIEKCEFERVAIFSNRQEEFFVLSPKDFYRCTCQAAQLSAMQRPAFDFSDYKSPETLLWMPSDTEIESTAFRCSEKPITVRFEDLRLGREALAQLRTANTPQIDYGRFVVGAWTSSKLADLNEASTRFFSASGECERKPSEEKTKQIRNWIRTKWGSKTGQVLLDQAVLAITPDRYYGLAPLADKVTQKLIDNNNPYASRTLMFLNEAAEHFHQEQQAGSGPIKSFAVSDYLQSEYGLGKRMATHGAAIICPDHKSKTFRHRKS